MWNIVLVDDEVRILEGLAKIISHLSGEYHVAGKFSDSTEAYRFMRENFRSIDLLITDIRMPGLSGLELTEKVHKLDREIPCAVLTGFSDFEYAKQAISLGVVSYLVKPVDVEELKSVLSRLVQPRESGSGKEVIYIRSQLSREVTYMKQEIESKYRDFDMNKVSEKLLLSKDYLGRLFKKETGLSPADYLGEVRMEQAKKLLTATGKYKVYEVCDLVGYEDGAYFTKLFKRKYGITPKDYQKYYGQGL